MDEELERRFDAMMRRINNNHEALLIEMRDIRTSTDIVTRTLRAGIETLQDLVIRAPALTVQALQEPILARLTAIEARLRKIEDK